AYTKSIIIVALGRSGRADPPNDTGSRNLNQWTIAGAYEFRVWIGLTEVAHRAVVDDPGATIRPEPDVGRTVECVGASRKGLLKEPVVSEPHGLELKRLFFVKVKQLDLMTRFWSWGSRIRSRKSEIALQRIEYCAALHRTYGKRVRREVDTGERGVGRLNGQR